MHGHTRPAGQQKPSPPVTARPILSIHPNRLGPSGLDRAIADRHARRGDANSHSPEGANVRFCVCWSTEIGGQVEGTIAVPGGRVWFQRIGGGPGRPLLVVHGGPGLPHNYLAPLRRLSDEREVIFWDQLGCGNSACPSDVDLWTMNRSVAEMATVAEALALTRFHIFSHSWGGMLAQQYVLDKAPDAVSLTIANSTASIPEFSASLVSLKSCLDVATRSAIDRHEAAGTTHSARPRSEPGTRLICAAPAPGPGNSRKHSPTWEPRSSRRCLGPATFASLGMFETGTSSTGWPTSRCRPCWWAVSTNVRLSTCEKCRAGLRARDWNSSSPVPTCRSSKSRRDSTG